MNEKLDIDVKTLRPFTKFIYTIGVLPTSYLMSMTYEEQLVWLCNYLSQTIIPTINNNAEAVKEVQDLVLELQEYINNYFDNLDVQEEINNKLDKMAETGELTNLIGNYINPLIENQNQVISNFIAQTNETIENQNSEISTIQNNTETSINTQNQTINSLSSRVDELSTLPSGSTTGDAELIDIRTGFNGVVYSNAGTAVRTQAENNNNLAYGLINGILNNAESITPDKLNVDNNFMLETYNYHQDNGATVSSGYITYIHNTNATSTSIKGKIIIKSNISQLKVSTRISGTNYIFYTFTNLKIGDILYLNKTITIPTSSEGTIRLLFTAFNNTERDFDVINPVFLQDNNEETKDTYGYENSSAGVVTYTSKNYKALATKDYVDNAISSGKIFSSMNFGCSGDSITTQANGATSWVNYVNNELDFVSSHNVAIGSSTYQFRKVTYNEIEYTPQNYNDSNFAGYSTAGTPTSPLIAQQMANNCAKNHIEQFIAEVSAGTYPTPDIFIFAYGTNDNTNIGSVEDAFSDTLANIDKYTLAGGMRYAVEKITTAFPNCQVFILNILQSAYQGYQSRANQLAKNNMIKQVADYFSIPVINQYDECGITRLYEVARTTGRYLSDGLHPNTNGKKKQAEYIIRTLKNKTTSRIN